MSKTQFIDLTDDPIDRSEPKKRKPSSPKSPKFSGPPASPKGSKSPPSSEPPASKKRSPKEGKKSNKKPKPKPEKPAPTPKPDIRESLMIKSLIKPGSISDRIKSLYTKPQIPPDAQVTELEDMDNLKPQQPPLNENVPGNKKSTEKSVKSKPLEPNLPSNKLDDSSFTSKPPKKIGDLGLRIFDKELEGSPVDKLLKWNSSISSDRVDIEIPKKRARSLEEGIEGNFSSDILI
ncbi:unnamed protein product [Blepharisma stoltei]|uniref:Uncharacterized protein n=1 Tax=Blepharisma stoltei TaxID=1481888 RepID=A0AAU9IB78_9CILI|nr:unnamed protein product [Blepharisma stoltei]